MPGVREDVTDIVLNLKGVAVKMEVEGPKRLEIRATGPGVVTAGDISTTNGIEILNRDHVILPPRRRRLRLHGADRRAG